ncbi:MAG: 8-oxo-dGTP diphosphatase [Defluviitaleaceae bacterium]|nr:8-oxo-dGTP diphosphatase [Defluviitaleaceae bacterium]
MKNIKLVTCVMIQNPQSGQVLVQNRKRKYLGWCFPGGHVESGESIYDCAVREVKEETGLDAHNLKYCGIVHWCDKDTDERYCCHMYFAKDFGGELIAENEEGDHFWLPIDQLFATPKERFSSEHYCLSPLFHERGKYGEVFILHSDDGKKVWKVEYR